MTLILNDDFEIERNWVRSPTGLILTDDAARLRYAPKKHPQAGDLFSGCGGASLGFKQAGFQVRFAVELWVTAAITYMCNLGSYPCNIHFQTPKLQAQFEKEIVHKDKATGLLTVMRSGMSGVMDRLDVPGTDHMWIWDAADLTGRMLLEPLGMAPGELDMLHGSPPCQGVSTAGHQNPRDPRNLLMLEYARLITEIHPKAFTMEQVPNVLNMTLPDGQPIMDAFIDIVEAGNYASRRALEKMIRLQGGEQMLLHRGRGEKKKGKRKTGGRSAAPVLGPSKAPGEIGAILTRIRQADRQVPA